MTIATELRFGVSASDYDAIPAIRASDIKAAMAPGSLALVKWRREHPSEPTPSMILGTAIHLLALEPHRANEVVVRPAFTGEGAVARRKAWNEEHAAHVVLTETQMETARLMLDGINGNPEARKLIARASSDPTKRTEAVATWVDSDFDVPCKARLDLFHAGIIALDLKTCSCAHPESVAYAIKDYGYHIQQAHYEAGFAAATGAETPFVFVFVESEPPYGCVVGPLCDETMRIARAERRTFLQKIAAAEQSGVWPGYADGVVTLSAPDKYLRDMARIYL